jgi:hypothetical protein
MTNKNDTKYVSSNTNKSGGFVSPRGYVDRKELWDIGNRRVFRLKKEYESQGYFVYANSSNHEGPDLIIIAKLDGRIVKVIESTNYARRTKGDELEYINNDNFQRYLTSLTQWSFNPEIKLELIVSFQTNLHKVQYKKLVERGITVVIVGHQD